MTEVKFNITWKTIVSGITGVVTLIGLLIGGVYAAEERYVSQSELDKAQILMASDIRSLEKNLSKQRIEDRIQDYVDKKQYIQDKIIDGTATPTDKKRLNRYNNSIESLQRELDRLEH
jgi:hypothetical protein